MSGSSTEGFPRTLGPYLLLTSFGRGGMGEVFLAKRRVLEDVDRLCVVKTIRGDLAESREYVARFLDEARLAVQLNHPNISQVYEVAKLGSDHCMSMEFIQGCNLREVVADARERGIAIPESCALHVTESVLEALAWAHAFRSPVTNEPLRIVHRDVSPANVMLSFDGDVKLIDFGLAESTLKKEETETRVVMGKVGYMSPEQARGEEVSGAADQFAAGVMLCELLLGGRFYGDWNVHQIWQVVGLGGHRPAGFAALPAEVRAVLDRALAPTPEGRYPTCAAFSAEVAELRATRAPRAGKAALRELMQALYADRASATRDVIASHADLRAPPDSHSDAMGSDRSGGSARAQGTTTDPWRTSASSPAPGRWSGGAIPTMPDGSHLDLTVGSNTHVLAAGSASIVPSDPGGPTQRIAPAATRASTNRTHQRSVLLLSAVVVVAAVVAAVVGLRSLPGGVSTPPRDSGGATLAVRPPAAPVPGAQAEPPAPVGPTTTEPANPSPPRPTEKTQPSLEPARPAPRRSEPSSSPALRPTSSQTSPAPAARAEASPSADGRAEAPNAAPIRPVRELYDQLARCKDECAGVIRSMWEERRQKKGAAAFDGWLRTAEPAIRRCATEVCGIR